MEKSIDYFRKGVINLQDRCVCCGEYVPEGRQICNNCETGRIKEVTSLLLKELKVKIPVVFDNIGGE